MAEKYPSHSPYNYCFNNPLQFIDPDGEEVGFAQIEARIAAPIIGYWGITGSYATGIMYDGTNFAAYTTWSLGLSKGGGAAAGITVGGLSNESVFNIKKHGGTAGVFAGAFTPYNIGAEFNTTIGDDIKITGFGGSGSTPLSKAYGGAGYLEYTNTSLRKTGTLDDVMEYVLNT